MNKFVTFILLSFTAMMTCMSQTDSSTRPVKNPQPILGDPAELKKMFGPLIAKKPQCELELKRENYLEALKRYATSIDKGVFAEKPLTSQAINAFGNSIRGWITEYKYFELDTGISKPYLKKLYSCLQTMYKASLGMDISEKRKDNKSFAKYKKIYNDKIDAFLKMVKAPEKPDRRVTEQLRIQKIKEHRLYQQYIRKLQKQDDEN